MKGKIHFCKRRGCEAPRLRKQFVCTPCWGEIPPADRHRYMRARRNGLTQIASSIRSEILRDLGRKPSQPVPAGATATQAYARTAAMLGEREDLEAAE